MSVEWDYTVTLKPLQMLAGISADGIVIATIFEMS